MFNTIFQYVLENAAECRFVPLNKNILFRDINQRLNASLLNILIEAEKYT